jgi:hypothetical protein
VKDDSGRRVMIETSCTIALAFGLVTQVVAGPLWGVSIGAASGTATWAFLAISRATTRRRLDREG